MANGISSNIKQINKAIGSTFSEIIKQRTMLIRNSSSDYKILVQSNIVTEKYANASWEYSETYKEYKGTVAPDQPYWKLSGDLFNAIRNQRKNVNQSFVGIPKNARNGDGEKISQYALELEYGKDGMPPRPVFGPTLDEYFRGGFQKRLDSAILEIINKWRA